MEEAKAAEARRGHDEPGDTALSARRPWAALYGSLPRSLERPTGSILDRFRAIVLESPAAPAIRYFGATLSFADLDRASDALAAALVDRGFRRGDRFALILQNDPDFLIALLAAWKAGGCTVSINPMNKERELTALLADSGARFLLCLDDLWEESGRSVVRSGGTALESVITASPHAWAGRVDTRVLSNRRRAPASDTVDLHELLAAFDGVVPDAVPLDASDVAVLTYTSGTTGRPKAAMNTHANLQAGSDNFRSWVGLSREDTILGIAPLFHITGLVCHTVLTFTVGAPLVLAHRFHPEVVLDAIRSEAPTFCVGAISAFTTLLAASYDKRSDFASFRVLYSGGAPIAPAVCEQFERATNVYIHNCYGLTETSAPTHATPMGLRAPMDLTSGALSIGVPVFDTDVRILGEDGQELPPGEVGELAIRGPQVIPGYWDRPGETSACLPNGELRTGDVGFMDDAGWFYLVDRKKDMINASGYKVWPREVEDVFSTHPDVREVAVVGIPDAQRGEAPKAFVSLVAGATVSPAELVEFGRGRMAAYKYPREVEIVDELPKTASGKILRRELRDQAHSPSQN